MAAATAVVYKVVAAAKLIHGPAQSGPVPTGSAHLANYPSPVRATCPAWPNDHFEHLLEDFLLVPPSPSGWRVHHTRPPTQDPHKPARSKAVAVASPERDPRLGFPSQRGHIAL